MKCKHCCIGVLEDMNLITEPTDLINNKSDFDGYDIRNKNGNKPVPFDEFSGWGYFTYCPVCGTKIQWSDI
jgi:hypothetical protein